MRRYRLLAGLLLLADCQATETCRDGRPALVQQLERRGVSDASTAKIVLVGSAGGYGSGTQVTIKAEFLIQEIWDTIYQSRPYTTWAASGFRTVRFYTVSEPDTPAAELLVNATDRCHVEGAFEGGFRCPGINRILEPLLKAEYEKARGP